MSLLGIQCIHLRFNAGINTYFQNIMKIFLKIILLLKLFTKAGFSMIYFNLRTLFKKNKHNISIPINKYQKRI